MRYILLINADHEAMARVTPEETEKYSAEYGTFTQAIIESGEFVAGDPLEGVDTATTVRLRGGEPVATDGPFTETKEYLCGYYVVDCADLDRAVELAGLIPGVELGSVEVRPLRPFTVPEMT